MHPKHVRAPSHDGGILQDPPLSEAIDHVRGNVELLSRWDVNLQGRMSSVLRQGARTEALSLARTFHEEMGFDAVTAAEPPEPLIVTGHQPELFHPGVWIKNFALGAIAQKTRGIGLNLIVDNDLPKGPFIRVPRRAGHDLARTPVAFDTWTAELPYEAQSLQNLDQFASFRERVVDTLGGLIPDPLIETYWPRVLAEPPLPTANVGLRFTRARRLTEADWGTRNLEVPLSRLCATAPFLWFTSHILANLARFREIHNESLFAYRRLYGIRSKNHPVAALRVEREGWQESPFWIWRDSRPRRHGLWIRPKGKTMELRIGGEDQPFREIPLSEGREACCAVEALQDLPQRGIRLRTRALTTTMFARLLLSDLFLHGIGGAKYDELGDEIIRGFYGINPPRFLTLSLTLHAGLPSTGTTVADLQQVDSLIRAIDFNPDRFLADRPEAAPLLEARREAIASSTATHRDRVARFHAIRRINASLQPLLNDARREAQTRRSMIRDDLRNEAVARSREYASVLHSASRLRSVFQKQTSEIASL